MNSNQPLQGDIEANACSALDAGDASSASSVPFGQDASVAGSAVADASRTLPTPEPDAEAVGQTDPLFHDALFRNKKKKSKFRLVEPPTPPLEAPIADTHAHLDLLRDPALVLARCAVHGVGFVCSMADIYENEAVDYDSLDGWLRDAADMLPELLDIERGTLCEPVIPRVRIAIGCHPHYAKYYDDALEARLIDRLRNPLTCALGEVGLDYHYDFSAREAQTEAFRRQIRVSHKTDMPLILHVREAHEEAFSILTEEGFPEAGVLLHCFNLDTDTLKPWLDRGCFAAFGGPLTFKNSDDTRAAAAFMDIDRILTETDAPFMTPEPMRGMECGPEHTIFTAARLAVVRGCEPGAARAELLGKFYENALGLLDRPPSPWQQAAAHE